ncbi:MAG: HutD/Ves family protein [Rubrivivax sp.]
MTLHTVHCDQVEPQPWRNGGGRTRELLAWPSRDDWQLRISVADIHRDGPFSPYPGVERWFAVVDGAGVLLKFAHERHNLDVDSAPLRFAGEDAPGCDLLDGPTRDLNLMVRREHGHASLQRAEPGVDFQPRGTVRALFCADALTLQIDGSDACTLAPFTLVWAEGGGQGLWRIRSDSERARAWWMSFQAAGAA